MVWSPLLAAMLLLLPIMRESHRVRHRVLKRWGSRLSQKKSAAFQSVTRPTHLRSPHSFSAIRSRCVGMRMGHVVHPRPDAGEAVRWWSGIHGFVADCAWAGPRWTRGVALIGERVGRDVWARSGCLGVAVSEKWGELSWDWGKARTEEGDMTRPRGLRGLMEVK